MDIHRTVLNLLTGRWIDPNGKLFQKLIREGFRYADRLLDYLEDIGTIYVVSISVESAVIGRMGLFTLEKNKRSSLQNLIQTNYSSDNLSVLIGITWEHRETKVWRNDVLMKFLHHPNLVPSKYRPNSLYNAFTKMNALEPEQILALARALY
ncbi:uncharacterized protein OCT59_003328 [Rhizophagus irregularis]|uniref:Uncharacterized protein n=1 Tax=Rhizophagus irregularis (strain DAOM 181602 / DAOM 197198 / MUCL 43194) TaxID=747089 RepID=A0A2P4PXR9_RHIID|nr:hypothetical protein GLOIN_2v1776241 [Rhizophagus irregularis DAOM 181602=DAOM 197198]POG70165.1 hypothetical protein GLOIN_2v1776241 [Rhizophagus irregularis DAOM 181602=DAOM 197198]UZO11771.1 hypothetical protein OCT59_003328 [Rhizophagus irregularis]GBC37245.2 hypothetical protein GLOIN_2v1776241 [Rhizophagus irregularis DAOM 181602=DAOM 197198]|eukprot:XP_025177031.1 hypothetical protein GLOIN_2v1776241 [Rhizophagus irregularis DAOM 181602=DAOM 197198]